MTSPWPWPAPEDDGAASHLVPGFVIPSTISLPSTTGSAISPGRQTGRNVLIIYPWTGSPGGANPPGWDDAPGAHGSTPQLQGYAALASSFAARGVTLIVVSGQSLDEQYTFADRNRLPFALASDAAGQLSEALRLPTFKAGDQMFLKRLTLIVETDAIIRAVYPVHPPDRDAEHSLGLMS